MKKEIYTQIMNFLEKELLNIVPLVATGKPVTKMYFEYHITYEVVEQIDKHSLLGSDRKEIYDKVMKSIYEIAKQKGVVA